MESISGVLLLRMSTKPFQGILTLHTRLQHVNDVCIICSSSSWKIKLSFALALCSPLPPRSMLMLHAILDLSPSGVCPRDRTLNAGGTGTEKLMLIVQGGSKVTTSGNTSPRHKTIWRCCAMHAVFLALRLLLSLPGFELPSIHSTTCYRTNNLFRMVLTL